MFTNSILQIFRSIPFVSPIFFSLSTFLIALIGFLFTVTSDYLRMSVFVQLLSLFLGLNFALLSQKFSLVLNPHSIKSQIIFLAASGSSKSYLRLIFILASLVLLLNFLLNGNFQQHDPTFRFSSIRFSWLSRFSSALEVVPPFLLLLVSLRNFSSFIKRPEWIIYLALNLIFISGSISKSLVVSVFLTAFLSLSIHVYPVLYFNYFSLLKIAIKRQLPSRLVFIGFPFIFLALSLVFLQLFFVGVSSDNILLRLANGFDQLSILDNAIGGGIIDPSNNQLQIFDQPPFYLVWIKAFIRPLFPVLYDVRFDNYTEFLQYLVFGKLTNSWSDTGWAPNNSMFTDIFLFSSNSLLIQFFLLFFISFSIFSLMLLSLKTFLIQRFGSSFSSVISLPLTIYVVTSPFAFIVDSQFFFGNIIIQLLFFGSIWFLFRLLSTLMLYQTSRNL